MSCDAATARFASRRVQRSSGYGAFARQAARRRGRWAGTQAEHPVRPNRDRLLERIATDFTLGALATELAMRGVKVDYVQVLRFVRAEGLSF